MDDKDKVDETVDTEEETTTTQAEVETEETTETPQPAEETANVLYELPDGRKVDGDTLSREWKENFLPEFTRKSQELASIKSHKDEHINNQEQLKQPWESEDYQPETWKEVIDAAKAEVRREQELTVRQEQERLSAIAQNVQGQLDAIKQDEPNIDENALFSHAMKYGFNDLKFAYQNMKDMKNVILKTEQRVAGNIKKRAEEPIATGNKQATTDNGYDPSVMAQFSDAREFLKSLKK